MLSGAYHGSGRLLGWLIVALAFCAICYTARLQVLHRLGPEDIRHKLAR